MGSGSETPDEATTREEEDSEATINIFAVNTESLPEATDQLAMDF